MATILMTEEYWANTHLSVVRYTGQIQMNGVHYIIVNKEGKDVFECSFEAEREGREKAIPPGEPCDLIDNRFQKYYRKMGRDKFMQWLKERPNLSAELLLKELSKMIKREKL